MSNKSQDVFPQSSSATAADLVMFPNTIIKNVDADKDGKFDCFQFDITNPFYTGEPVSAIRMLKITIDGEIISPERVSLLLREQRIGLKEVPTLYELLWGFGETASIRIEKMGGLNSGRHEVDCMLLLRPSAGDFGGSGDMKFPKKTSMFVE